MKRQLFIITFILLHNLYGIGQIGIFTNNHPFATMQVAVSDKVPVGVKFPTYTGDELKSLDLFYTDAFNGVLVYVNKPVSTPSLKTRYVRQRGFYSYDATHQQWCLLSDRYLNYKTYAIVNKSTIQLFPSGVASTYVEWNTNISGIFADDIVIDPNKIDIEFPPNRVFRITAMISVGYIDTPTPIPTYIVSYFERSPSSLSNEPLLTSTWGYVESSTEAYDDGGVTKAITTFYTGVEPFRVRLKAFCPPDKRTTRIAGPPGMQTIGSYLLIEEL